MDDNNDNNNSLSNKIKNCYNFLKGKIKIGSNENCHLIEKKRKIYYFSNFSLDIDEFYFISKEIKQVKENVFKNSLECLKYTVNSKEKEKINKIKIK